MIFWVFAIAMTVAVLYALARPMLRGTGEQDAPIDAAAYDVAVFKSQLREIDRDLARGRLTEEEAEASRVEIGRRLLAADRQLGAVKAAAGRSTGPAARAIGAALLAGGVIVAILIYDRMGDPSNPDMPLVLRQAERDLAQAGRPAPPSAEEGGEAGNLDDMAARLRARLDSGDGTPADWSLLGRTEMMRGNYAEAARAYKAALASVPDDPALNAAYGEALVFWADGTVTDEAAKVFDRVLAMTPGDPRGNFYMAEYDWTAGRRAAALDRLVALLNRAEPGAPWVEMVRERAEMHAAQMNVDLSERLTAPQSTAPQSAIPPGPTAEDMDAAEDMSPEARQEMIRGMVDGLAARLAEDPSDFDGWQRLIRSRMVLGDQAGAQAALDEAAGHFAAAPFPMRQLTSLAAELGLTPPAGGTARGPSAEDMAAAEEMAPEDRQAMIAGMVDNLAARLEDNPDDLQGWVMLGRSYSVLGRTEDAIAALEKASDLAPRNVDILIDRARMMRELAGDRQTPETVALMARVEELAPRNIEALWFLGLDAYRDGDRGTARTFFDRALAELPEGSAERQSLESEITRLYQTPVGE